MEGVTPKDAFMDEPDFRRRITLFGKAIPLPQSRLLRISVGILLIVGGLLGFLPILGFWMLPLGVLVLSYEFAMIRRWRRRGTVWWGSRNGRRDRRRDI
ncbi:hypothetical protein [Aliihoeflea aestuarii]|jgi:hypothetical protein|uniref:hypothetical protein n=1 Tax=Aliihoeflea aestuarii TaxID=453840 RepID=UPI0035585E85